MAGSDLACVTSRKDLTGVLGKGERAGDTRRLGDTIGCPSRIWHSFTVMGLSEISHWLT